MKAKRIFLLAAVFVLTSLLLVNVASAAWYACTITRVGATGASNIVYLTHDAATPLFSKRNFVLNSAKAKELLAIALTAYSSGKRLYVSLGSTAAGSTVAAAYMID